MSRTTEVANPQIFNHQLFGELPVMVVDGVEWFGASEAAIALEFSNPHAAIKNHVEEDDLTVREVMDSLGRTQKKKFVNESGLYSLIFGAARQGNNPEIREKAKAFKRWVTAEILPAIRKHGAYMTEQTIERALTDPDFLIQLATQLKAEREARKALEAQIKQDKPFTTFGKSVAHSSDAITFGEFAKLLNNNGIKIGRNRLFDWMRKNGYLIKSGREKNKPKQQYVEQGLFQVKESVVHAVDHDFIRITTLITGKGQLYFLEQLKQTFGGGEKGEGASR
ncbi:MAG: hypothetical protein BAA01_09395 [Bacillus thermozeamaize]|uniref:Bro-N domain-containing protein n=1 Tax=Bacillus thermozeamaize TaxID=230954 RepID=A0A1Y3PED6_9BACI|nr:MAG: hypothetical protein BAA01_09395 [Bacillus thermozeamaize]